MDNVRIAVFTTSLAGGGAERAMLTLADGLASKGYCVDFVVARAVGPLREEVPASVRLVDCGASRIITCLPALINYFRREQPSAMISALAPANCVAIWARIVARSSTRLVISAQNTLSIAAQEAASLRERKLPLLMRYTYPKADCVVASSSGVADDLSNVLSLARERIAVVYNPVVTSRMLALSEESVRHPWLANHQPPVILGVGRLTKQKDFSTLFKAFALLRERRDVRLIVLGEGEERVDLERLAVSLNIAKDVDMPGFVNNPYAYMRQAALFALSSRWEGFGNVVAEALACGTPVVSTDCPSGPAEIIDNNKWGSLVPVGDASAMSIAMENTLDSKLCCSGEYTERVKDFSVDRVAEQYIQMLDIDRHG